MRPDAGFWAGRPVCVTGGTGFLGYQLVTQLRALAAKVRVLALRPAPNHPLLATPEVDLVWGDVRDPASVRRGVAGCAVVFHTAGIVAVWGPAVRALWSVHVEGTQNVLRAADPGARIVHTSSVVAVGASRRGVVLTEESPFNLGDVRLAYIHAKRAAEVLALQAAERGQDVVVTNPAYLVGPEDYERSVMGRFCVRFWKGRAPVLPPGGLNLADVRDVATGHLLAAERGQSGRRYILGGENHTYRSLAGLLAEAAGFRPRGLLPLPWWALCTFAGLAECRAWLTGKEPYPSLGHARLNRFYWFSRSDRALVELGYRPRPLPESLAEAFAWHHAREPLRPRGLPRWLMRPAA